MSTCGYDHSYIWGTGPDIIHVAMHCTDQDIVVRGAKFVAAFKRGGHRVLINPVGDMIVRPAAIEASVRLLPGPGSVAQHLLTNYVQSFVAVLLAQFTHKRIKGGSSGVVELARANGPIQVRCLPGDFCKCWIDQGIEVLTKF